MLRTILLSATLVAVVAAGCARPVTPPLDPGDAGEPSPGDAGSVPAEAPAALAFPVRGALSPDGVLYVSDSGAGAVFGYRGDERVFALGGLDRPLGIAVSGERLFVGSAGRQSVQAFSRSDGSPLFAFGAGDGEVSMPNAIAVTPDGSRIYVADSRAHELRIYDARGALLGRFGGLGATDGAMRFPAAVAVDGTRVVVADQGNHRVQVFDLEGNWKASFGDLPDQAALSLEAYRGRLVRPQALCLMGEEIAVLDAYFGTVQVFTGSGEPLGFAGGRGECETCVDLALDLVWDASDETFVVMDPNRRRWVRVPFDLRELP